MTTGKHSNSSGTAFDIDARAAAMVHTCALLRKQLEYAAQDPALRAGYRITVPV